MQSWSGITDVGRLICCVQASGLARSTRTLAEDLHEHPSPQWEARTFFHNTLCASWFISPSTFGFSWRFRGNPGFSLVHLRSIRAPAKGLSSSLQYCHLCIQWVSSRSRWEAKHRAFCAAIWSSQCRHLSECDYHMRHTGSNHSTWQTFSI